MSALFAYGTLQLPEVMLAVTGRRFAGRSATLENYVRQRLSGERYPGIRPEPGASVTGICFCGIAPRDYKKLDEYEGHYYRREALKIVVPGGFEMRAQTYVVREEFYGLLLREDWDLGKFRQHHLQEFLENQD